MPEGTMKRIARRIEIVETGGAPVQHRRHGPRQARDQEEQADRQGPIRRQPPAHAAQPFFRRDEPFLEGRKSWQTPPEQKSGTPAVTNTAA